MINEDKFSQEITKSIKQLEPKEFHSARLTTLSLGDISWVRRKIGDKSEIGTIYKLNFDTFCLENNINPYQFIYNVCKGGWHIIGDYEYKIREIPEIEKKSKNSDTNKELSSLSYKTLHYGI